MALISLKDVTKIYPKGSRPALDDISLDVDRGDFVFLVGASGSGKTTLLRLLLREEEATEGEIRVAGNDLRRLRNREIPGYRRSIGFVFQDYKLLNNKTVWQNVAFTLEVIGARRSTIKTLVPQVLKTVGLTGKEQNYPHELSGGEAQRVALARAYVNNPEILLADEPTGNLDPTTSLGIMEVLDAINRTGTTVVMATHNEEIVNSMRKRVVELHTGRIMRDEAHGSYDSSRFFPDAEVAARSHHAIGDPADGDALDRAREVGVGGRRPVQAVVQDGNSSATEPIADGTKGAKQVVQAAAQAVDQGQYGDEGIARLAKSMHSGRTGRYGQVFTSVEDTLTWGKGLGSLESAQEDSSQHEEASSGQPDRKADSDSDERFRRPAPVSQGSQDRPGQSSEGSGDKDQGKTGTDRAESGNRPQAEPAEPAASRKSRKSARGSEAAPRPEDAGSREQDRNPGRDRKGLAHDDHNHDHGQGGSNKDDKVKNRQPLKESSAEASDREQQFKRPDVSSPAQPTGESGQAAVRMKQDGAQSSKEPSGKSRTGKKDSTNEIDHDVESYDAESMGTPPAPPAPPEAPKAARKPRQKSGAQARDERHDKKKAAR
ncbi:cell division ATP-binding protein FtsE [Bifidobacterium kimbladii]|uniref:Cell division ATP-binding protein FtsE n=1 Tax=Bifidobacterium asteroides TaxID=1684 RepID=A0A0F4KUU7_9BIFI|nr:FtsE-like ATP binding protein in cell [Bifidobacterium asteroides]